MKYVESGKLGILTVTIHRACDLPKGEFQNKNAKITRKLFIY